MRKRIYASPARRGVYTPRVDLGAYTQTSTQYRLRTISGRWIYFICRIKACVGCGLLTNDNPASTRKRPRIGWSLGGARERLRIRKVLAYFTEKHGRRHFNDGISISFACRPYCINNDLKFTFAYYVFRNFRFVGSNFEGLDHRVATGQPSERKKTRIWESDSVDCRSIVFVTL